MFFCKRLKKQLYRANRIQLQMNGRINSQQLERTIVVRIPFFPQFLHGILVQQGHANHLRLVPEKSDVPEGLCCFPSKTTKSFHY